ncbi:MAG TPA: DUF177 domain-containing protein [Pseudolabrys sp.]|nr:DUF177 domain-containing protein [Pseudolabrys sp.]
MEKTQNAWSVPVAVEDIPDTGLHVEINAPEPVRATLAASAGLREMPRLSAVFDLARKGAGVCVTGKVKARVGQKCVVTLEPIESDLDETVDLIFAAAEAGQTEGANADEAPEPLVDGKLDLGAIATEFLFLGIDPYPRKADAEFAPLITDDGGTRPFAGLEALKKRLGGD